MKTKVPIIKDEKAVAMLEQILTAIKSFIDVEPDNRTYKAFKDKGHRLSNQTIKKYFSSWDEAYDIAKFGEPLYSKSELINRYNLPENFVRGVQHIPAFKEKLVVSGKNNKEGDVYKIKKSDIVFVVTYYENLKKDHDNHKSEKGWFTLEESLQSVYATEEIVLKMECEGKLERGTDFVYLDRLDWKHVDITNIENQCQIMYLHRDAYKKFQTVRLLTMLKIFQKEGVRTSFETLAKLRDEELIEKKAVAKWGDSLLEYYDAKTVLKTLTHYLNNASRVSNNLASYNFLNDEQQQMIDSYIEARENGVVISWNGYRPKRNVAHAELRLPETKHRLANVFFSIICGRCRLNYSNGTLDHLPNEELDKIDPDVFKVFDINIDDYACISKNRKTTTLMGIYRDLKPFYYWLLMRKDLEPKNTFDDYQNFESLKKNILTFLNQFPQRQSDAPAKEKIDRITKVFLTREELIRCRDTILKMYRSDLALRYAAIWVLCATTGLRPEELVHLRLDQHFVLDEHGLIALNDKNYGEMIVDKEAGKGEYSISHQKYNSPIPVAAVEQINLYLKDLYKRQGQHIPKGKGYFLRSHPMAYEKKLKVLDKKFIRRLRVAADFLPPKKRENIILKSTRHSLNTLMKKTHIKDDHLRDNVKELAMHYQMRHKPKGQSMGDKYYLEDISRDEYYAFLEKTINFPWNLELLKKWELSQGIVTFENDEEYLLSEEKEELVQKGIEKDIEQSDTRKELLKELEKIQESLRKLKVRDKKMEIKVWMETRKELQKRQQHLLIKLSS
ncbi:hypothetical protein [Bacillus sp. MUM 116]|uniref:hypothetical protein n=1 Tax=Bacillus sp. MUM 116 TaxID=1678002 RepID=UPI00114D4734|nr:hypothetical protein [Bacillus sp. MUM 116]